MTRIWGFPRLHLSLFDLGSATPRQYGGVGFAIDGMPTVVTASTSDVTELLGIEKLDNQGMADVWGAIHRIHSEYGTPPMSVHIETMPPQHIGLGTKTSLVLGVLQAIAVEAGIDLPISDVQRISGRGGTSGIGIHTFFSGGLVVDAGHQAGASRVHGPSSASSEIDSVPSMLVGGSMPYEWLITLILPNGISRSGFDELEFFRTSTPIPNEEVFASIGLGAFGLTSSAFTGDFRGFARSLNSLQTVGFKAREIAAQPAAVANLLDELHNLEGCGAGMSSMGPMLFTVTEDERSSAKVLEVAQALGAEVLGSFRCRNRGHDAQ
jgi:beta-ribofuranosylaminobenzene 5'-phosphate synthase